MNTAQFSRYKYYEGYSVNKIFKQQKMFKKEYIQKQQESHYV